MDAVGRRDGRRSNDGSSPSLLLIGRVGERMDWAVVSSIELLRCLLVGWRGLAGRLVIFIGLFGSVVISVRLFLSVLKSMLPLLSLLMALGLSALAFISTLRLPMLFAWVDEADETMLDGRFNDDLRGSTGSFGGS